MAYAIAEEHRLQQFGGTKPAPWKTPLRRYKESLNVEYKVQGATTPAAYPAASLMNQSFKSDYKPAPWHTPSRLGEEFHDL